MSKVFSPRFVVKFKQAKLLFCSKLKMVIKQAKLLFPKVKMVRSERDVVAAARFVNFKLLLNHKSFDAHNIPAYR